MITIQVYLDTGNVYSYNVATEAIAREHANSIVSTGYRSVSADDPLTLTWFPPHRIVKVKIKLKEQSTTNYFDTITST